MKRTFWNIAAGALLALLLLSAVGCQSAPSGGEGGADGAYGQGDMRGFVPDPFSIPLGAEESGE